MENIEAETAELRADIERLIRESLERHGVEWTVDQIGGALVAIGRDFAAGGDLCIHAGGCAREFRHPSGAGVMQRIVKRISGGEGTALVLSVDGPWVRLATFPGGAAVLSPWAARELALEIQAAAERIDPQPPPRPDRGPKARKGR